jgi:hypothetical protein
MAAETMKGHGSNRVYNDRNGVVYKFSRIWMNRDDD